MNDYLCVYLIGPRLLRRRSSIPERYFNNTFINEHSDNTRLEDMYQKYFHVHDFSYYYTLDQLFGDTYLQFIKSSYNGILLCYNIAHRSEFEDIKEKVNNIERALKYKSEKAIIYLVGNKNDEEKEREVSTDEAIEL